MMNYVVNPNLPEHDIEMIVCGTEDKSILDFFEKRHITVLKNEKNSNIDPSVSTHADMALLHLGDKTVLVDTAQTTLILKLQAYGFCIHCTKNPIKGQYPDDISLNFTVTGDKITGNFKFAESSLRNLIKDKKIINVKQGYSKCSTLVVNENAVITDDETINRELKKNGVDCLLISKGDIRLEGHDYGFIGGASGKISKDKVIFFGNIGNHRDFRLIEAFLIKHHCTYVCTDNLSLRDIGGMIPLIEKQHS